jgi:hypothetical protein
MRINSRFTTEFVLRKQLYSDKGWLLAYRSDTATIVKAVEKIHVYAGKINK